MTGKIRIAALLKTASLILGVGMSARGQTPLESNDDYLQTVWTTENGLPQNSITSILQTPDGYLWLGTFGGLARFDGVRFTTFSTVNTPGMKSNRILTLCESKNGMLWMGTESGEVMSYKDGVATTYTTRDGLPGGYVWACREDSAGTLWIGTQHGLERFRNGRFTPVGLHDGRPQPTYGLSMRRPLGAFGWQPMPAWFGLKAGSSPPPGLPAVLLQVSAFRSASTGREAIGWAPIGGWPTSRMGGLSSIRLLPAGLR